MTPRSLENVYTTDLQCVIYRWEKVTLQVEGSESSVLCNGVKNSWSQQCLCMAREGEGIMRNGIRQIDRLTEICSNRISRV